jgi:hypothetical protein
LSASTASTLGATQSSDYHKAIASTLQKAQALGKVKPKSGLSDLATSLEGTISDDSPSTSDSQAGTTGPTDNSLRSQIIRNAIAKGKEQEQKQSHPLAGGLFDSLQGLSGSVGSEYTSPSTVMPTTFMAPYAMVQKANGTQSLV